MRIRRALLDRPLDLVLQFFGELFIVLRLHEQDDAHVPGPLKGLGITFITTGLIAMAFMTFSGI